MILAAFVICLQLQDFGVCSCLTGMNDAPVMNREAAAMPRPHLCFKPADRALFGLQVLRFSVVELARAVASIDAAHLVGLVDVDRSCGGHGDAEAASQGDGDNELSHWELFHRVFPLMGSI